MGFWIGSDPLGLRLEQRKQKANDVLYSDWDNHCSQHPNPRYLKASPKL